MADHWYMEPRFKAGVDMLRRTGAKEFQIRYQDDEQPVVWLAVVGWPDGRWATAAALGPGHAVLRLCEQVVDGGICVHCRRSTAFEADDIESPPAPLEQLICWYQFDPELATFRRGCEGDDR